MSAGIAIQLSSADNAFFEGLVRSVLNGARLLRVTPLKADTGVDGGTLKGAGYGTPIRLDVAHAGRVRSLVLHTASSNDFGHDRRADRAAEMLLAADTFPLLPNHVLALDVGAYRSGGGFVSLRDSGEFYLLTSYAEGQPYVDDLRRVALERRAEPLDLARVELLAEYLVRLHQDKLEQPSAYTRSIRDLVGGGEGIFGIVDAYPERTPGVSQQRLLEIEQGCLSWRERLKRKSDRLRRIHGDFHPFNLLFDPSNQLLLLDASRGSAGDPADDVTALTINYLFFALESPAAWQDGFRPLWQRFWDVYLQSASDAELATVLAPFFCWRALVLACPRWYPDASAVTRDRLLSFAERLLAGEPFRPRQADELFAH
ncbi:MAG TPA: phosphotransferase [Polyangiaceae bacterium]|nr:phosphotransferase [Polyangiaceae bacterium]